MADNINFESTELYRVWMDYKPSSPTLRIEWKQKEDLLPKFIASLEDWQKEKVYDCMRNYIMTMEATGNRIHNFYAEYNNEEGIEYLKNNVI